MFRRLTEVFDELCQSLLSRHTEPRTRCPVTQLSRRDTNPHQGLSQRCVCLLRMGVEAEHESFTAFFEAAGGDGPHSELARIRNPPDRHRLHCSLGPLHGQRKECGRRLSSDEWAAFFATRHLGPESALRDQLGNGLRSPVPIHDDRDPRAIFRGHDLPRSGQHSGKVRHGRWNRLGREKGQLAHRVKRKPRRYRRHRRPAVAEQLRAFTSDRESTNSARKDLSPTARMRWGTNTVRTNRSASERKNQTARTPVAWGPLVPWPTSNSTRWFSSRVRKPLP